MNVFRQFHDPSLQAMDLIDAIRDLDEVLITRSHGPHLLLPHS
jgi:hypothetical protein